MAPAKNGGPARHDGDGGGGTPRASALAGATSSAGDVSAVSSSPRPSPSSTADEAGYVVVRSRKGRKSSSSTQVRTSPREQTSPRARTSPRDPTAPGGLRGRSKYSPLDRSIFQLVDCLRKDASPAVTAAVLGRVQRTLRSADDESRAVFEREYDAASADDCVALHTLLHRWLILDRIRLVEFKLRLGSFRVLNAEPEVTAPPQDAWRLALTSTTHDEPVDPSGPSSMEVDSTEPSSTPASVVCNAINDALRQHLVRGTLVVQLEGSMRLHPDSSFQAKLRQLTDISPEIAAAHRELKPLLVNATYDQSGNRLFLYLRTREDAERWAGKLVSLQGRLLPLCLPSSSPQPTATSIDVQVYRFRAYNLGGNLSMLDVWHLFHGLLGLKVEHLAVARPVATADADPQLWDVHVRHDGCPPSLKGKTRVVWGADTVWLHHTAFSSSPPCTRCTSPAHPRRYCKGAEQRPEWTLQVVGPKVAISDTHLTDAPVTSDHLDAVAREEERRLVECSLMAGEDRPAADTPPPPGPRPIIYSTPLAVVRRKRFDALRARCLELALPERLRLWRILSETDPDWQGYQDQFRLQPPPCSAEPTFLQLLRKASMWKPTPVAAQTPQLRSSLTRALQRQPASPSVSSGERSTASSLTNSAIRECDDETDSDDGSVGLTDGGSEPEPMDEESEVAAATPSRPGPPGGTAGTATAMGDANEQDAKLVDATGSRGQTDRPISASSGQQRHCPKASHVGKAHTVQPRRIERPRASKDAVKFAASNIRASRLLRENPVTGDVEPVPAKVTQLTVARFFAPRAPLRALAAQRPHVEPTASPDVQIVSVVRPDAGFDKEPPSWSRIKSALGVLEVTTPANGSCFYFAIGAAKINMCPARVTCRDRKMRREGCYYRREINMAILARLTDLLATGTFDREHLCRRFLSDGQQADALPDLMERHFRTAATVSCVDPCTPQYWAHEEELLGTAFWFGEPIFVFEVLPDDRVILQVFRGFNDQRGARGEYWPVDRGVDTIRGMMTARVLPLLLVYYPGASTTQPSGHFNALRLPPKRYLEWAGTAGRRARMAKRRTALLTQLGLLPLPSDDPDPAPSVASTPSGSEFEPSQGRTEDALSLSTDAVVSSDPTPSFPASPLTPSSPPLPRDLPRLLRRLQPRKPVPESLELPLKKVQHGNKMAYIRWRDTVSRADSATAALLRTVASPVDACAALQQQAADAVDMLRSLPYRIHLMAQLDDAVLLSLGRALVCEARLCDLRAYATLASTPRRRAAAVAAWVTAGEALARLDARWNLLHEATRWRRLLPAAYRARRAPAELSDQDLCRVVLALVATAPDFDDRTTARSAAEQAAVIIARLAAPHRSSLVAATAASLARREWAELSALQADLRRDPTGHEAADLSDPGAHALRC